MKAGLPLVVAAIIVAPARGDLVFIGASRDNTLYENPSGDLSNGAGGNIFAGLTLTGQKRRALLRFNIAGAVPPGSTVTGVVLSLHLSKTISADVPVSLHRALVDWGEGASVALGEGGQGANAEAGDATWLHTFYPGQFWQTPGAGPGTDYAVQASATAAVGNPLVYYTWGSTPQLVADVQAWLDAPASNFGWIIIGDETAIGTAKRFDSREHAEPSVRPFLTVTYSPPCYANCDASTNTPVLTANDFLCFLNLYANGSTRANCDGSTGVPSLTPNDFQCFLNQYAAGCS